MKRALIIIPAILFLLIAVALIAPSFIDWNQYKPQVQAKVKETAGLDVELAGDIGFSILPSPAIQIENVTLKAPEGSKNENAMTFERLDVNVDLIPLLSKKVSVNYITLVKPEINLELLASNKLNIMTPEIEAMLGDKEAAEEEQKTASASPEISFNKVVIKDGLFNYYDHKSKTETVVRNINTEMVVKSVNGPFSANGSLFYAGNSLDFEFDADKYDPETMVMNPKIKLALQPGDIKLSYSGAMNLKEGFEAQGQLSLNIANVAKTLQQNNVSGLNGLDVPLETKGMVTANSKKADYKDFSLSLGKNKTEGSASITFSPLEYSLKLKADDKLVLTKMLPQTGSLGLGIQDIRLSGSAQKIEIDKAALMVEQTPISISGGYSFPLENKRAKASLSLSTKQNLDYDTLSAKLPKSNGATDIRESLKTLNLPFDLNFGLDAHQFTMMGQRMNDFHVKAEFTENNVKLTQFDAKNFASAHIRANAEIKNIKALQGISLNSNINAQSAQELAKALGVDASSLPKDIGKANIKAALNGSADMMEMTTNVSAMKGELIAEGKIKNPLTALELSDLSLQIKHSNMAEALQAFTGAAQQDPNFKKPMDIYAKITQSGQTYKLDDLKGNLAGTSVQGNATVDLSKTKPFLKGDLKFGKINLESSVTTGNAAKKNTAERWSKETIDTSGLHALNADVNISAVSLTYGPWPLQAPSMRIKLNEGTLDITGLQAGLFDGKMGMDATVKSASTSSQPINVNGKANLNNVSVSKLIVALSGSQLIKASGNVSTDVEINATGSNAHALVNNLGGKGTVSGNKFVLNGVDVTRFAKALSSESKPGDTILGVWKGSTKGGSTSFDTLDGNFDIANGIVNIRKMDLDGPKAAIATKGVVNLPQWTLDTKHTITVKPVDAETPADVPPFEMSFKGSLDNPAQTFGQGVLQDYLNRKINRKVEGLIKDKLGEKLGIPMANDNKQNDVAPSGGDGTAEQQPAKQQEKPKDLKDIEPEDVVKDVLKGLLQ